jgi:hypothetical protein
MTLRKTILGREDAALQVFLMGRAGFEPATLRIKVPLDKLKRTARNGKTLQLAQIAAATNCREMQVVETSLYAHPYAHLSPR